VTRDQLEHLIRAASSIAEDDEIVVIGSQSILGQFPDASAALLVSNEADVFPRNHPDRADLVDGSIGEGSPFHRTFGYYAQGVGEDTATLPSGWRDRLIPVHGPGTRGATGLCLEIHDLVLSKYAAGRAKDIAYVQEVARQRLASASTLRERLATLPVEPSLRAVIEAKIGRDFG
jgi:hypothetical protein